MQKRKFTLYNPEPSNTFDHFTWHILSEVNGRCLLGWWGCRNATWAQEGQIAAVRWFSRDARLVGLMLFLVSGIRSLIFYPSKIRIGWRQTPWLVFAIRPKNSSGRRSLQTSFSRFRRAPIQNEPTKFCKSFKMFHAEPLKKLIISRRSV